MYLVWRLISILLMLGGCFTSYTQIQAASQNRPHTQSSGDPLVLAFYYTWFDEQTWSYDKLSDLPAQTYVSRDRAVMGRHIDEAKRAGIDAFMVAWYGPNGQFNQTEPNLAALLEEAAARNFKIGILFETDSPFFGGVGDATAALQHALSTHVNHPAFLRVDGRPVIFFWRPHMWGVETWRSIRSQVDPGYSSIWISEGVNVAYLSVFDGHHLYSNTWNPPSDLGYTNQKFANWVQNTRQQYGIHKYWVATVMPGYDDVRIRPAAGFATGREGGAYYERSWQAAIASNPDWIIITSFNEWPEGTYIEPSVAFGDRYLGLTAAWSQQFKSRGNSGVRAAAQPAPAQPAPAQPAPVQSTPTAQPTATPLPEPDRPTAYVETVLLNLRGGPSTTDPIVGQAPQGTALQIVGKAQDIADWWQVADGEQVSWVYASLVRAAGPLDQVPFVQLSIQPTAQPTVQPQQPTQQQPTQPQLTAPQAQIAPIVPNQQSQPANYSKPLFDPEKVKIKPYLSN